jgi:predicted N-acetyltransferase YhbS
MNETVTQSNRRSEKSLNEIKTELLAMGVSIRPYSRGDEAQVLRLLNICFGNWGSMQEWTAKYLKHPSFDERDVFLVEKGGEIIGHEALHFRNLTIDNDSVISTVSLSDAAVHPDFRGYGLHSKLLDVMLHEAKGRGASLAFSWYLRDSGLHKHSRKIGFIEIKQPPAYMKIIRPEKLLRSGLLDFLHKSPGLKEKLNELANDLYFGLGRTTFSLSELFDKCSPGETQNKRKIGIIFNEYSLVSLVRFRNMTKHQRLLSLISMLLLRRVKIRFGSIASLVNLTRKSLSIIGSI